MKDEISNEIEALRTRAKGMGLAFTESTSRGVGIFSILELQVFDLNFSKSYEGNYRRAAKLLNALDTNRPTIVCLCGSTRFWREFQRASLRLTLEGKIVLSIGAASGTDDEHFGNLPKDEYDALKEQLDTLHFRKIDLADEVLILNVEGYIGESTRNELEYARKMGKVIRFLEPTDD